MIKKILIALFVVLVIATLSFVLFVTTSYQKDYSEEYPIAELKVEADSARLARGEYLVYGPAHCGHCHAPFEKLGALEAGEKVPLTGGFGLEIPPGKFNAPNITPDVKTGIGRFSDGQLYRMLRHNIRPNGQVAVDFMPFINMSEEDIYSIIAYLRSTKPVEYQMPETELTFLGKTVYALGAIKPIPSDEPIQKEVKKEVSVAYGKYLAYAVANCRGCHTNRDMKTGEYIGEEYAGGMTFGPDNLSGGWTFVTPNLTNDPTGVLYNWTEEQFLERMLAGRIHANSPMPWSAVSHMDEGDLRSVYRFLMSLKPIKNEVGPTATEPTETASVF